MLKKLGVDTTEISFGDPKIRRKINKFALQGTVGELFLGQNIAQFLQYQL